MLMVLFVVLESEASVGYLFKLLNPAYRFLHTPQHLPLNATKRGGPPKVLCWWCGSDMPTPPKAHFYAFKQITPSKYSTEMVTPSNLFLYRPEYR